MFWKLLIIAAFIGMLKPFLGWIWDNIEGSLSWLLSFVIMGLFFGILLAGIMIIGEFLCICSDMYIFGCHPFWVGFCIGTGWNVISRLIFWIRNR